MKKTENQDLLKKAKQTFIDYNNYSDEEILSYYKLYQKLSIEGVLTENFVSIHDIEKELQNLPAKYSEILKLIFFERKKFRQLGELFSVEKNVIFRWQTKALRLIQLNMIKNYEEKKLQERKSNFFNSIKSGIMPKDDLLIEDLRLSSVLHNVLIKNKIYTVSQLLILTEREIKNLNGVGKKTAPKLIILQKDILSNNLS